VVSVVLAFSYFAPALGVDVAPVQSHNDGNNCGRFGYGYHGGKHNFVCPSHEPKPAIEAAQAVRSQALPATSGGNANTSRPAAAPATKPVLPATNTVVPATKTLVPATKAVIDVPVSDGVGQWRGFTELLLRQLS
jgi:hypothetical protein